MADLAAGHTGVPSFHLSAVDATRALIEEATVLADTWTGDRSDYAARAADLDGLIADLQKAREPLTRYVRTLPLVGRTDNPVVKADRAATRTLKRLRALRRRTMSREAPPKPRRRRLPASGRSRPPAPVVDRASLVGTLSRTMQIVDMIDAEHRTLRRVLGSGSWRAIKGGGGFLSMAELNAEAGELLHRLDAERARLNLAWGRYDRGHARRRAEADNPHAINDERHALYAGNPLCVVNMRDAIRELRAAVKASATQTKRTPGARPAGSHVAYEAWNHDEIVAAWLGFRKRHKRWPTKADHAGDPELPHYTQLRRVMGEKPMAATLEAVEAALR